jgi:ribonuclease HI
MMEALAIKVIIESDSKKVVKLVNEDHHSRSEIRSICHEIREVLRVLPKLNVIYVSRNYNQAAHLCAKQASPNKRRCPWINSNE